jgi:hypothetical protein
LLTAQFLEQRLGILHVRGVKVFGEPILDFGEHRALFAVALIRQRCARFYVALSRLRSQQLSVERHNVSIRLRVEGFAAAHEPGDWSAIAVSILALGDAACTAENNSNLSDTG